MAENNTPKKLTKTEFKDILKTIEKDVKETFDLQTHSVFVTYLENELKARGYDLSDKTLQKQLDNWAMNNSDFLTARGSRGLLYEDLKRIDNEEGIGFVGLTEGLDEDMNVIANIPDTPTNVVDERKFYNPSDDLDEFGLPLTDEAREEIRSLDNQLIDDSALNGLTMPESPQELLETGKPGNVVLTEDGYKFLILPDGQLTDGDMVYGSLRELRDEVSADIIDTLNSEEYKSKLKEYKDIGIEFNDQPGGSLGAAKLNDPLVFDSWVDNYAKTTTSFVDNLPLSTTVKNQFNNLVQGRAKNLATPGGVADAVDVWELGVLGLMIAAVAYKEYDEIPTILTNKAVDMFNSMTSSYGIPPVSKEEYDLDYEFINKVVKTGEKFMPTDIIIKKVGDVVKGAAETGAVTGFGYVPPNLTNTDTMETTQKIQPGVQEEKMFEQLRPKKTKSAGGSGARIQ